MSITQKDIVRALARQQALQNARTKKFEDDLQFATNQTVTKLLVQILTKGGREQSPDGNWYFQKQMLDECVKKDMEIDFLDANDTMCSEKEAVTVRLKISDRVPQVVSSITSVIKNEPPPGFIDLENNLRAFQ